MGGAKGARRRLDLAQEGDLGGVVQGGRALIGAKAEAASRVDAEEAAGDGLFGAGEEKSDEARGAPASVQFGGDGGEVVVEEAGVGVGHGVQHDAG